MESMRIARGWRMSAALSELRRVFEAATAMSTRLHSRHRSGAALRRVELPTRMAHSFGKNFHSRRGERRRRNRRIEAFLRARKRRTPRGGLKARQIQ
jgi:hypothetical protein